MKAVSYLIMKFILRQFQTVPSFFLDCNIPNSVTITANLCCDMQVTIFVGKYCRGSVSNTAAIIVCCGEAQQLGPRSVLQVGRSEGVDLHIQRQGERWAPGGYWGCGYCNFVHTVHLAEEPWWHMANGPKWNFTAGVNPLLRFPVVDNAALIVIIGFSTHPAGVCNRGLVPPNKLCNVFLASSSSNPCPSMVQVV